QRSLDVLIGWAIYQCLLRLGSGYEQNLDAIAQSSSASSLRMESRRRYESRIRRSVAPCEKQLLSDHRFTVPLIARVPPALQWALQMGPYCGAQQWTSCLDLSYIPGRTRFAPS